MDWKQSLDRYLTTEPPDDFTPFIEAVYNHFTDEFLESMGDFEDSETENRWMNTLYERAEYKDIGADGKWATFGDITPEKAARIIERAYHIFIKKEQ